MCISTWLQSRVERKKKKHLVKLEINLSTAQKVQIASENEAIKLRWSIIAVYTQRTSQTELSGTEQSQCFLNVKLQKMINEYNGKQISCILL